MPLKYLKTDFKEQLVCVESMKTIMYNSSNKIRTNSELMLQNTGFNL